MAFWGVQLTLIAAVGIVPSVLILSFVCVTSSCIMRVVGQGVIGDLCEKNSGYCAGMDSF